MKERRIITNRLEIDPNENYQDKWICPPGVTRFGFYVSEMMFWFHRLDGPACVFPDGRHDYYVCDKRHRLDGPAIEYSDNHRKNVYYQNGKYHRNDGPAFWHPHDNEGETIDCEQYIFPAYHIFGKRISRDDFIEWYEITHLKIYEGE